MRKEAAAAAAAAPVVPAEKQARLPGRHYRLISLSRHVTGSSGTLSRLFLSIKWVHQQISNSPLPRGRVEHALSDSPGDGESAVRNSEGRVPDEQNLDFTQPNKTKIVL